MRTEEHARMRAELLGKIQEWCGPFPDRGNLNIEEIAQTEYRTHTEIKLFYDAEPGERVPAYLLLPRPRSEGKLPAVLALHQCAWECDLGKDQVVGRCPQWPDQAYGFELVREGFIVLAPDASKVGERFDPALRERWQTASVLGNSPDACCTAPGGTWGSIRWKPAFDATRGIDVLSQYEGVDPQRIGVIGHSLGADTVLRTMPHDERIAAAVISGGGMVGLNTDDAPYGVRYSELLKVLAPRPFFEVFGTQDHISGSEEMVQNKRTAHSEARDLYDLYEKGDDLAKYEFDGGHSFPTEARKAAYGWLHTKLAD